MPWLDIKLDEAKLAEVQAALAGIQQGLGRVVTRALNKVAFAMRSRIADRYVVSTTLNRKWVLKCIRVSKANFTRWASKIGIRDRKTPLLWYNARQTAQGVTFKAPPGAEWALDYKQSKKGRLVVPHAFIRTMPKSGHKGVFVRRSLDKPEKRGKKGSWLRIDELFGASVYDLFAGFTGEAPRLVAEAQRMLHRELDTQVQVLIDQQERGLIAPISSFTAALVARRAARGIAFNPRAA